jgi:hypothetical protein
MLRKTMIVLLTTAALTGGLAADAFAHGGGGGGGGHGGGFGGGGHMGGFGGGHFAVAWVSAAALRVCMMRRAATSAAITFIVADASGSAAAMTTGATSTHITHRTAICMGTDGLCGACSSEVMASPPP